MSKCEYEYEYEYKCEYGYGCWCGNIPRHFNTRFTISGSGRVMYVSSTNSVFVREYVHRCNNSTESDKVSTSSDYRTYFMSD